MSGGRFNYGQRNLGYDMFPYSSVDYGLGDKEYSESVKEARKHNPLEDKQISELVFDVLCLIHSADWYLSGDTSEKTYRKDVNFFKAKWLKAKPDDLTREEIDKNVEELRDDLYLAFGLREPREDY